MTVYNVRVSVVGLVDADDPLTALIRMRKQLRDAGFEPYEGDASEPEQFSVFESEDQS